VINCAELVSKYVGDTGKNIEAMFKEAKAMDAILVFDDAEALFGKRTQGDSSTDRHANMDTGNMHLPPTPNTTYTTHSLFSHTQRFN